MSPTRSPVAQRSGTTAREGALQTGTGAHRGCQYRFFVKQVVKCKGVHIVKFVTDSEGNCSAKQRVMRTPFVCAAPAFNGQLVHSQDGRGASSVTAHERSVTFELLPAAVSWVVPESNALEVAVVMCALHPTVCDAACQLQHQECASLGNLISVRLISISLQGGTW